MSMKVWSRVTFVAIEQSLMLLYIQTIGRADTAQMKLVLLLDFGVPQIWGPMFFNTLHLKVESAGRRQTYEKSRFTEEQIIRILKVEEAGQRTNKVCRKHG